MRRTVHPLAVLLLAPVLLLTAVAQLLVAMWTEPAFDGLDEAGRAAVVERVCPVDALLVMGAAQYDGVPSGAFERRLAGALQLADAGCAETAVISGGQRPEDRLSEGEAGVRWLAARAPDLALAAETRARTSVENLRFSADLLPDARWLVVTDDLHVARVRYAVARLGLDAQVVGVGTRAGRPAYALREVVATIAYRLGAFR